MAIVLHFPFVRSPNCGPIAPGCSSVVDQAVLSVCAHAARAPRLTGAMCLLHLVSGALGASLELLASGGARGAPYSQRGSHVATGVESTAAYGVCSGTCR